MKQSKKKSVVKGIAPICRHLCLSLEKLEDRVVPASGLLMNQTIDWTTATGTDASSTLLVGIVEGANYAVDLLAAVSLPETIAFLAA